MADNGRLSPKKRRAIASLLVSRSVEAAALTASVSPGTLWRWLREDPEFTQALNQAQNETIAAAVRALVSELQANFATMRAARDDTQETAAVRLRAAQALDNSALRWIEQREFSERLTRLEAAIYGNQQNTTN